GEVPSKAKRPEKENRIEREIDESVYNPDYKKYPEFCKKDCALIIPDSMLKRDEEIFLDDLNVTDIADALQTEVCIVESSGDAFLYEIVRLLQRSESNPMHQ
ncbi:MAG: DUF512 domain-containing protein, partial [Lachnospiraceae bacterium]|nr:DUF512 domain-containing protein [Lachnospiraceae bacterium]